MMDFEYIVKSAMFGVAVGDALGVPVEFSDRAQRDADPVTDMREYGTHNQPKGTWSDDSSMAFAAMDSLADNGSFVPEDVMKRFADWYLNAEYTPHGRVFDIGITCSRAITDYKHGVEPLLCGGRGERDNGNGSLMRIMPFALMTAAREDYWDDAVIRETAATVHDASSLTHGHPRSLIACLIYASACHELVYGGGDEMTSCLQRAVDKTFAFYENEKGVLFPWNRVEFQAELDRNAFHRLRNIAEFRNEPRESIKGSGYVLDTLEAAFWCLLNSESYEECVLKAVNLGDDTDTVGAVAGGLAGIYYGYDGIPGEWIEALAKREWIETLCTRFAKAFQNGADMEAEMKEMKETKVLICDDSNFARANLKRLLQAQGVEFLVEAGNGEEAVKQYLESRPNLVFMDIAMPKLGGLDALKEILQRDGNAKVVMLSSPGTQDSLKDAIDAGAYDFLQKPVDDEMLLRILEKAKP